MGVFSSHLTSESIDVHHDLGWFGAFPGITNNTAFKKLDFMNAYLCRMLSTNRKKIVVDINTTQDEKKPSRVQAMYGPESIRHSVVIRVFILLSHFTDNFGVCNLSRRLIGISA